MLSSSISTTTSWVQAREIMHRSDLFTRKNDRKVTEGQPPVIVNFVDFCKLSTVFTDQHCGTSLNSMEYQGRPLPLSRSYMRRATARSERSVHKLVVAGANRCLKISSAIAIGVCNNNRLGKKPQKEVLAASRNQNTYICAT